MRYDGVLFDLFGTLVPPFRRREHEAAIRRCAGHLGIDPEECHRGWTGSYRPRIGGRIASVEENFALILRHLGRPADDRLLAGAAEIYQAHSIEGLAPLDGALELLDTLRARGLRIGLVSNCAPDIPEIWERTSLAPRFDHCAFSCRIGIVKPLPGIYRAALDALDLAPERTLYIGDGSDDELSGAARCGMDPVLVAADLSNTYDARRNDVEEWRGRRIGKIIEAIPLIEEKR